MNVAGDPFEDVSILQDKSNLVLIMQDGIIHKDILPEGQHERDAAARTAAVSTPASSAPPSKL
jgi:hypothetical protein